MRRSEGRGLKLPGASVLLTGASGGIGQALALALHEQGARLLLSARRTHLLEPLAQRTGARVLACDLADRDQVLELARAAADADVLIANAGIPAGGEIREHDVADIDRALEVNLRAPMVLSRLLAEQMVARGGGHIVFMSSLSGKAASPGGSIYSATKFGLRGYALSLREDLHPHGVGVSTVFPGFIRDAGMFADSGATLPFYVGTRTPAQVARAVITAIEHDQAEVSVAPRHLSVGSSLAGLAPALASRVQRLVGAAEMSSAVTSGQARARARDASGDGDPR